MVCCVNWAGLCFGNNIWFRDLCLCVITPAAATPCCHGYQHYSKWTVNMSKRKDTKEAGKSVMTASGGYANELTTG